MGSRTSRRDYPRLRCLGLPTWLGLRCSFERSSSWVRSRRKVPRTTHSAWTPGGALSPVYIPPSLLVFTGCVSRWMFDCCRVPGTGGKDWSVTYAQEGDTGDSGHVVLIRKGRFWRLDPFKGGQLLSSQDLERCGWGPARDQPNANASAGRLNTSWITQLANTLQSVH